MGRRLGFEINGLSLLFINKWDSGIIAEKLNIEPDGEKIITKKQVDKVLSFMFEIEDHNQEDYIKLDQVRTIMAMNFIDKIKVTFS